MTERMQLQTIGNYRLGAELGVGTLGKVFRAEHIDLHTPSVVKIMHAYLTTGDARERWLRGLRQVKQLDHPNIVEVLDAGEQDGQFYLVMEELRHGSLRSLLQQQPALALDQGVDLIREVADALAFAHARGVFHLDLHPENLLLLAHSDPRMYAADYTVKVSDFGLAQLLDDGQSTTGAKPIGKAEYMAPELCRGHPGDARSDIYALGVMLYEIASSYLPFKERKADEVCLRPEAAQPPSLRRLRPDLPDGLESIVLRCLAAKTAERFGSAAELSAALREVSLAPEVVEERELLQSDVEPGLPRVLVTQPNHPPRTAALTGDGLAAGRHPDCAVLIPSAAADRHAEIDWDGAQVSITDLGAPTGALLDGRPLPANMPQPWGWSQTVTIGNARLQLAAPSAMPIDSSGAEEAPKEKQVSITPNDLSIKPRQIRIDLPPGQVVTLPIALKNLSKHIDHYTLGVDEPLQAGWVTRLPEPLQLGPGEEGTVEVQLKAPKSPKVRSDIYATHVRVHSRAAPDVSRPMELEWHVLPFDEFRFDLPKPTRRWAIRHTIYPVVIRNIGNLEATYELSAAADDEEQMPDFEFDEAPVMLAPDQQLRTLLHVRPRWRWYGRPLRSEFAVSVWPAGQQDTEAHRKRARLIHHALIAPWMLAVALVALIMAALLWSVIYTPKITRFDVSPDPPIGSDPVRISWQVDNAPGVQLRINGTPVASISPAHGEYAITVVPTATVSLELVADHRLRFLTFLEQRTARSIVAVPPTSTPTLTPTVKPDVTNTPSKIEPGGPETTGEPVPTTPTITTESTATLRPSATPTPTPPICQRGVPFGIEVSGDAGTPFLVYFDKRAVTGGTIKPDGKATIWLIVGDELDNVQHSIAVYPRGASRWQADATPLPVHTLAGDDRLTSFYCIVPAAPKLNP